MPHHSPRVAFPFFAACLATAACSSSPRQFQDAFPDATVLLTTTDPEAVRAQLLEVQAPSTSEHHELLLGLLRGQQRIRAANLVLLARAVDMPTHSTHHTNAGRWQWARPGEGDAKFLDALLSEGLDHIGEIDRRWFGELIGLQQQKATLQRYCAHFLAQLDDGSATALQQMLGGMPGSPMVTPFVLDVIAKQGKLDEARMWVAFDAVSFDANRLELLRGLLDRGLAIDDAQLVRIMQTFSFDEARADAFLLLAPKVPALSTERAHEAVATFSFDSGRQTAFAELGKHGSVQITDAQLVTLTALCSFDSGRIECVKSLRSRLVGTPNAVDAQALLATFSFDSDRVHAVEVMAPRWRQLGKPAREGLLGTFSFDSSRREAGALLE